MIMNFQDILSALRRSNIIRLRLFNFKLFGNWRWGLYNEFSIDDITTLIKEFRAFTAHNTKESTPPTTQSFKAGSNFAILARLCEQYYIYEGSNKLPKKIADEVADIIADLRNDDEAQAQLEAMLDARQNNIMRRFRTSHPHLKEKDFRLYAYISAGFSATTIAVLLNKDKTVIYNRISRLKKNINQDFV